jgi:uncharacterized membrane protein
MFEFVKTTVLGGLLFLLPVVVLVLLLEKALAIARGVVAPVAAQFPQMPVLGVTSVTAAAIVLLLLLSFLAGLLARTQLGKRLGNWIEHAFLSKMPGYVLLRGVLADVTAGFKALDKSQTQHSVLVELDEAWQLGFVVDKLPVSGRVAVFVPGAPSPLSGSVLYVLPEKVRATGLSVTETTSLLARLGRGSKEHLGNMAEGGVAPPPSGDHAA